MYCTSCRTLVDLRVCVYLKPCLFFGVGPSICDMNLLRRWRKVCELCCNAALSFSSSQEATSAEVGGRAPISQVRKLHCFRCLSRARSEGTVVTSAALPLSSPKVNAGKYGSVSPIKRNSRPAYSLLLRGTSFSSLKNGSRYNLSGRLYCASELASFGGGGRVANTTVRRDDASARAWGIFSGPLPQPGSARLIWERETGCGEGNANPWSPEDVKLDS